MVRVRVSNHSTQLSLESSHPLSEKETIDVLHIFLELKKLRVADEPWDVVFSRLNVADQKIIQALEASQVFPKTIKVEEGIAYFAAPLSSTTPTGHPSNPSITLEDKLFAAIHLDHLLKGSSFEGGSSYSALEQLAKTLKKMGKPHLADLYKEAAVFAHSLENIQDDAALQTFSSEFKALIPNLKVSVLIPGGYTNPPKNNHAMYYLIQKEKDGLFSFSVFNSGEGVDHHPAKIIDGKSKHQLVIRFGKIPSEQLDAQFFYNLLNFQKKHVFERIKTPFKAENIYKLLKEKFGAPVFLEEAPFMSDQIAGTCFWSSVLPHLRIELGEDLYKKLKFEVKFESLQQFFEKEDKQFFEVPDRIYLLEEAAKKFASSVLKIKHLLTKEELEGAEKICSKSLEKTQALRKQMVKKALCLPRAPLALENKSLKKIETTLFEQKVSPFISPEALLKNPIAHFLDVSKKLLSEPLPDIKALTMWQMELDHFVLTQEHEFSSFDEVFHLIEAIGSTAKWTEVFSAKSALTFAFLQVLAQKLASREMEDLKNWSISCGLLPLIKYQGLFLLKEAKLEALKDEVITCLEEKPPLFSTFEYGVESLEKCPFPEEQFLLDEEKVIVEARRLYEKYENSKKPNDPKITVGDFEKIAIFQGFEPLLPPLLAKLKKISLLSFQLENKPIVEPQIHYFIDHNEVFIHFYPNKETKNRFEESLGEIKDLSVFNLKYPRDEAEASALVPKEESDQKLKRLKKIFSDPDLSSFRVSFILNALGDDLFLFSQKDVQTLFEAYLFCVDGKSLKELSEVDWAPFLNRGFEYFAENREAACFFLRLDHALSSFTGKNVLKPQKWFEEQFKKGELANRGSLYYHKCLGIERQKSLDEEELFELLSANLLIHLFGAPVDLKESSQRLLVATKPLCIHLLKNSELRDRVLNRLSSQLFLSSFKGHWEGDYPNYKSRDCQINLERGELTTSKGYLAMPQDLIQVEGFFPEYGLLKSDTFVFEHPTLGELTYFRKSWHIAKTFDDGKLGIRGLTSDQSLNAWIAFNEALLFHMEDGSFRGVELKSGKTIAFIDDKKFEAFNLVEKGISAECLPFVEALDDPRFVYCFQDTFHFLRILTDVQKPLVLQIKGKDLWSDEFGKLCLSDEKEPYFKDEEGSQWFFFRDTPIDADSPLLRQFSTSVFPTGQSRVSFFLFQKGEGEFLPKNDRERAFLIALMLGKNRFKRAAELLNGWPLLQNPETMSNDFARILQAESWQGANPNQIGLLIKVFSKIPFNEISEKIATDYLDKKPNVIASNSLILRKEPLEIGLKDFLQYDFDKKLNRCISRVRSLFEEDYGDRVDLLVKNYLQVKNNIDVECRPTFFELSALRTFWRHWIYLGDYRVVDFVKALEKRAKPQVSWKERPQPFEPEVLADYQTYFKRIQKTESPSFKRVKGRVTTGEELEIEDFWQEFEEGEKLFLSREEVIFTGKRDEFLEQLDKDIEGLEKIQKNKRGILLQRFRRLPEDRELRTLALLERDAGKPLLEMKDLIQAYFRQDGPGYSDDDLLEIQKFLVRGAELSLKKRFKRLFLSQDEAAWSLCFAKRCYNPFEIKSRAFLVFEYFTGFLLRESQLKVIERFCKPHANITEQLVMGAGKTKVITPFVAFASADGKTLPIVVVQEALLKTQLEDLVNTSFQLFQQKGTYFSFNRETAFEFSSEMYGRNFPREPDLAEFLFLINRVKEERGYLITTPKAIHAFILAYVELFETCQRDTYRSYNVSFEAFEKVFDDLESNGKLIIDEIDAILNCRDEVLFSTGSKKSLPKEQISFVAKLYDWMCQERSFGIENNQQHLMDHLSQKLEALASFGLETLKLDLSYLPFVLGKALPPKNLDSLEQRNLLLLLKGQVTALLPLTLSKKGGEKYAPPLDQNAINAPCIPYLSVDQPKEGSEFGHPIEMLNYSFQYYLSKGVTKTQALKFLNHFKLQADHEKEEAPSYLETESAKRFEALFNCRLTEIKEPFEEMVNRNRDAKLLFVQEEIAPFIGFFETSYASDAQLFSMIFKDILGETATPWNELTYPDKIKTKRDRGEVGEVMYRVMSDPLSQEVRLIKGQDLEVLEEFKRDDVRALIDVGAFFEGLKPLDVATKLLNSSKKPKGVLYFEKNQLSLLTLKGVRVLRGSDEKAVLTALQAEGINLKEVMTYYDQSHSRGIDIPQDDKAKALLFIGKNSFREAIFQGAGRMRKLMRGQGIIPVMLEKEAEAVGLTQGKLKFKDLVIHSLKLQAKQVMEDNFRATSQKIKTVFRRRAFKLLRKAPREQKIKLYNEIKKLTLFHQKSGDYLEQYVYAEVLEDVEKVLWGIANRLKDGFKAALQAVKSPLSLQEEGVLETELMLVIEKAIERLGLPKQVKVGSDRMIGTNVMTEVKKELKAEIERQIDYRKEIGKGHPTSHHLFFDWNTIDLTLEPEALIETLRPFCLKLPKGFSKNLLMTNSFGDPFVEGFKFPLSLWDQTAYHVLAIFGTNPHYFLVSINDVKQLKSQIEGKKDLVLLSLFSLKPLFQKKSVLQKTEAFKEILIQLKFLICDFTFLKQKENFPLFEKWWKSLGEEERERFEANILSHDGRKVAFKSTKLKKLMSWW